MWPKDILNEAHPTLEANLYMYSDALLTMIFSRFTSSSWEVSGFSFAPESLKSLGGPGESYRQLRNRVNTMIIKLKKQYFSNKISACKGNVKESWKTMNKLLHRRSKSFNFDFLKDGYKETRQRKDISSLINGYFCSVGENLARKIENAPNPLLAGNSVHNAKNS